MKGTSHKILSVILALVLVVSMFATVVAPASGAITGVTVTPASKVPGAVTTWNIAFTTAAALVVGDQYVITLPTGVTAASVTVNAATATTSGTDPAIASAVGQVLTLNAAGADGAGAQSIVLNVTNPAAAGTYTVTVGTQTAAAVVIEAAVASAAFGTGVGPVTFTPVPTTAGATATWTIGFTSTAALVVGDTISIVFPSASSVPTTIAKEYIVVNTVAATIDAAVSGNTVIVTTPVAVGAGGAVAVVFSQVAGIKNPNNAAITYTGTVETSKDPGATTSAVFNVARNVLLGATSATVGSSVTVTGVGFLPNSSIDLTGSVLGAGLTDPSGSFSIAGTASVAGVCTATDGSGATSATGSTNALALIPAATLAPTSGLSGSVVTVTVSGLTATTAYGLGLSGASVDVISVSTGTLLAQTVAYAFDCVQTDATGKFVATIAIPSGQTAGPKVVNVRASDTAGVFSLPAVWTATANAATGTFTIDSRTLSLSVASGYKGDTVVVNGAGFEPSAAGSVVTAQIVFNDSAAIASATLLATPASVGSDGSFIASVKVPANSAAGAALAAGRGTFVATSSINGVATTSTASAFFTINPPTITASPTTGLAGSEVVVTMKGLGAYATYVGVRIDGATNINFAQSAITDANGNLSAKFIWPGLAAGAHTFVVTDGVTPLTQVANFTQQAGAVTITGGLNSVAGKYTKVWTFDGATQSWKLYDTAAPSVSDLSTLVAGQGYWMEATENATIVYGGNTYTLYAGWNLIGWRG